MPWMAPSHPAPLLPLKLWKPSAFSGLALCLGAAAPDLEFVLLVKQDWVLSHTLAGQLFFTVPVVMLLHALLTAVVFPWLVPLLKRGAPWHFEDLVRLRPASTVGEWTKVALSALIGGLSHVVLDGFTHGTHSGWAVPLWPALATPISLGAATVPFHDALHVTLTIILGAYGIWQTRRIGQRRLIAAWYPDRYSATREATGFEKRGALGYFIACALLGIAVGASRSHAPLEWIELGAFGLVAFTFYGLVFAALGDRLRLTRPDRRALLGPPQGESQA